MNVTGEEGKTIPFQKMHVLGNDFVIIDGRQETLCDISLFPDDIQKLCDRNRGIGCDQLLWVKEKPGGKPIVLVYNPDGSSAQACGNGTCCVAWLIMQKNDALECVIFVGDRLLKATRKTRQTCTLCVDMGAPQFFPDKEAEVRRIFGPDVYVVSMGICIGSRL